MIRSIKVTQNSPPRCVCLHKLLRSRSFYFQGESLNLLLARTKRLMINDPFFYFILHAFLFFPLFDVTMRFQLYCILKLYERIVSLKQR